MCENPSSSCFCDYCRQRFTDADELFVMPSSSLVVGGDGDLLQDDDFFKRRWVMPALSPSELQEMLTSPRPDADPSLLVVTSTSSSSSRFGVVGQLQQEQGGARTRTYSRADDLALTDTLDVLSSPIGEASANQEGPSSASFPGKLTLSPIIASTKRMHLEKGDDGKEGTLPKSLVGEKRLKIQFSSMGTATDYPQRFGLSSCEIAHGLSGTHQLYQNLWKFTVEVGPRLADTGICPVTWTIVNLTSNGVTMRTETWQEATKRQNQGRTICNIVLKTALEARAVQLESLLPALQDNPIRVTNIQNQVRILRPKYCIVGLLAFGLLHEAVQRHLALSPRPPANCADDME